MCAIGPKDIVSWIASKKKKKFKEKVYQEEIVMNYSSSKRNDKLQLGELNLEPIPDDSVEPAEPQASCPCFLQLANEQAGKTEI
ncbi:hypothetical protein DSO57_1011295 [Entomophthora muscae]|uniref:Uncharacterized protein n=1 Tax=Entomophthora muscae TaxID=34485 RepID=A0ACC2SJR1_9FUNG|nr:hypothetical protein DSO57_1011295 [Entomophthora muscae]